MKWNRPQGSLLLIAPGGPFRLCFLHPRKLWKPIKHSVIYDPLTPKAAVGFLPNSNLLKALTQDRGFMRNGHLVGVRKFLIGKRKVGILSEPHDISRSCLACTIQSSTLTNFRATFSASMIYSRSTFHFIERLKEMLVRKRYGCMPVSFPQPVPFCDGRWNK